MAQAVRAGGLEHASFQPSFFKRPLYNRLMKMMPAFGYFRSRALARKRGLTRSSDPHRDDGAGVGASHQTGWTALVAKLIQQYHR
jgi:hypothetical protein